MSLGMAFSKRLHALPATKDGRTCMSSRTSWKEVTTHKATPPRCQASAEQGLPARILGGSRQVHGGLEPLRLAAPARASALPKKGVMMTKCRFAGRDIGPV